MNIQIRPVSPADVDEIGRILYEAFSGIADRHNFPQDFPSLDVALQMANVCIHNPDVWGVVAESEGKIVGSNFLWEQNEVVGVGPITVDPKIQSKGIGKRLMQAVIERGKDAAGIRLVQDAFNSTSMSLYTSLGFDIKEPLVIIEGKIEGQPAAGVEIRRMEEKDFAACGELCDNVHGFSRLNELRQTAQMFPAFVAVRENRVVGYASAPVMWQLNHAVAETTEDMQALLSGAAEQLQQPLSFLLPTRQSDLFRWCLSKGMKVVKPMSLMSMGGYIEPRGCFLPSVLY
jgi:predicted N-acetyltransferase YhbS